MPQPELKSCPFCGPGESVVEVYEGEYKPGWRVGCGRCGSHSGHHWTREQAVAAWNCRAPLAAAGREGEAVAFVIDDSKINELQISTIGTIVERAKRAHFANVYLRINGKDELYEADWIKYLRLTRPAPKADAEGWYRWTDMDGYERITKGLPSVDHCHPDSIPQRYTHAAKADAAADWVLVPREPTPEMMHEGACARMMSRDVGFIYARMLAASPARGGEGES